MPLYTYIVSYKTRSYVVQLQRSNFQGFYEWVSEIPEDIIPKANKSELAAKIMRTQFSPVSNRKNVWSKSVEIDNADFTVFAVHTHS